MKKIVLVSGLVAALFLSACKEEKNLSSAQKYNGTVSYLARIALAPNSELVLEIREAGGDKVVAERTIKLDSAQVPIPFEFPVASGVLQNDGRYVFRAAIRTEGSPSWVSPDVGLVAGQNNLGEILLNAHNAQLFSRIFQCGDTRVSFGVSKGGKADMQIANVSYAMESVSAASGAKYRNLGDPSTVFWNKGDEAFVTIKGEGLPKCVAVSDEKASAEMQSSSAEDVVGKTDDQAVSSVNALPGSFWRLEDLNKAGVIDNSQITLSFDKNGRLSGSSGCNSYSGSYTLGKDEFSIHRNMISTMRACTADSVMEQERKFLKALSLVNAVTIDDTGALVLTGDEGTHLLLRDAKE